MWEILMIQGLEDGMVYKLLGAGLGGIICSEGKDIWGLSDVLESDMVGVGHSGDQIRGQRHDLPFSPTPGGLTFLVGEMG